MSVFGLFWVTTVEGEHLMEWIVWSAMHAYKIHTGI